MESDHAQAILELKRKAGEAEDAHLRRMQLEKQRAGECSLKTRECRLRDDTGNEERKGWEKMRKESQPNEPEKQEEQAGRKCTIM